MEEDHDSTADSSPLSSTEEEDEDTGSTETDYSSEEEEEENDDDDSASVSGESGTIEEEEEEEDGNEKVNALSHPFLLLRPSSSSNEEEQEEHDEDEGGEETFIRDVNIHNHEPLPFRVYRNYDEEEEDVQEEATVVLSTTKNLLAQPHVSSSSTKSSSAVPPFKDAIFLDVSGKTVNVKCETWSLRDEHLPLLLQEVDVTTSTFGLVHPSAVLDVFLCLGQNQFTDEGVRLISEFFLAPKRLKSIRPKILRLHMNKVSNDGCEHLGRLIREAQHLPAELHLSHNLIEIQGCRVLFEAVAARYGTAETGRVPLWLRLEHNVIDLHALEQVKKQSGIRICSLPFCTIHYCKNKKIVSPHAHCKFMMSQRRPLGALLKPLDVLRDPAPASGVPLTKMSMKPSLGAAMEQKKEDEGHDTLSSNSSPLTQTRYFLLLDTNAVYFCMKPDSVLSFTQLSAQSKSLGPLNFTFILLETVWQQLEAQKSTNAHNRQIINSFFGHVLPMCEEAGIIYYLSPLEMESRIRSEGFHIATAANMKKMATGEFDSDGMIIDCGLLLARKLREAGHPPNVLLLLTNDRECRQRSLHHLLPAELPSLIDSQLRRAKKPKGMPAGVQGEMIFDLVSSEVKSLLGKLDDPHTSASSTLQGVDVFSALTTAVDLVSRLLLAHALPTLPPNAVHGEDLPLPSHPSSSSLPPSLLSREECESLYREAREALKVWSSILVSRPNFAALASKPPFHSTSKPLADVNEPARKPGGRVQDNLSRPSPGSLESKLSKLTLDHRFTANKEHKKVHRAAPNDSPLKNSGKPISPRYANKGFSDVPPPMKPSGDGDFPQNKKSKKKALFDFPPSTMGTRLSETRNQGQLDRKKDMKKTKKCNKLLPNDDDWNSIQITSRKKKSRPKKLDEEK